MFYLGIYNQPADARELICDFTIDLSYADLAPQSGVKNKNKQQHSALTYSDPKPSALEKFQSRRLANTT